MANLPAEILSLIFPHLVQRDQLECMTVCKLWYKFIQPYTLFRNIHIDSQKHLEKLITQVLMDPSLGAKTDRLILNFRVKKGFEELMLVELFPNVREFRLIDQDETKSDKASFDAHPNHPWCDRIEKLVDSKPLKSTNILLKSGLCKSLTHISLLETDNFKSVNGLFKLLKNTPSLATLELKTFSVTSRDLELLHSVVPTMRSILLKSCYIDFNDIPLSVEPATSVTSFRCIDNDIDTYDGNGFYIKYIAEKYPHLEDWAFEIHGVFDDEDDIPSQEAIYKGILIPYLTKLGTRLKSLSITVLTYKIDFSAFFDLKILDDCGCQLEKLELSDNAYISTLEQLSMTNQAKHIQSLSVYKLDYNPGSTDDAISLQWLSRFEKLKELTLDFPYRLSANNKKFYLNLPDLLDPLVATQVDTLRIENVELHVEMKDEPRTYPSIKNIFLHEVEFQWHTDVRMAKALPNLKRLTLDSCFKDRRLFTFPNLNLSYCQISHALTEGPLHVLMITVNDGQQRLYTVNKTPEFAGFDLTAESKDIFSMPPVTSVHYGDTAECPFVTIICKSLSQFNMRKHYLDFDF